MSVEFEKDLEIHLRDYIKLNTKKCECCRCIETFGLLYDETDYEFYCKDHLKEMLTDNDNEFLKEFLSGSEG